MREWGRINACIVQNTVETAEHLVFLFEAIIKAHQDKNEFFYDGIDDEDPTRTNSTFFSLSYTQLNELCSFNDNGANLKGACQRASKYKSSVEGNTRWNCPLYWIFRERQNNYYFPHVERGCTSPHWRKPT